MVVRDAEGVFHPTLTTGASEREARFAPAGQWLAYRSNATGRGEVYVQSYPPGQGKWRSGAVLPEQQAVVLNYAQALKR